MANERYSDNEIMELFADCDTREAAFRIVVSQYGPHLYSRIRTVVPTHDEADDILQNTFIKAWRAMPKFRLESSLYTWLFRIATNEALTHVRKSKREMSLSLDDSEVELSAPYSDMENSDTGDEIADKLRHAVDTLPAKQKLVFCMKYYKEMKYDDIAEALHTSVGALKASYHHAVKKIENFLAVN